MQTFGSIGQAIAWFSDHTPSKIAIVHNAGPVTYRRLAGDLGRCVYGLRDNGIEPGMLVGLHGTRRYTQLLIMLACELIGATVTSVLTDDDDIVPHCDIVFTGSTGPLTALPKTKLLPRDWLARLRPASGGAPSSLGRDIPPDQIVRVIRTSGTSGQPKAMPLSHATRQRRLHKTIDRLAEEIMPVPRLLCPYPLNIGFADVRVLGVLYHGGTVYFAVRNEVDLINTGAVNYAIFLNGDADDILKSGAAPPDGHKVCIEVFGASVAPALRDRIRRQFKSGIWNTYASNETNVIAVLEDDNVGTLERGMEVRLVDEHGDDVAPGQSGRIRVRGDTMVDRYFNAPELTRESFIDGWFQTNDLGRQPAPGKLLLLGRIDDVLNIGGVKVPATPIEARIRQLEHVSDAALLRIGNDDDAGMLLVAVETTASDVTELEANIRAILAPYRTPSTVVMSRSLPRTRTGKIQRHEIEVDFRARGNGEFMARV